MKTIITIENNKVTVQVDDQEPVKVEQRIDTSIIDKAVDLGESIAETKASLRPGALWSPDSKLEVLPPGDATTGKQDKICPVCGDVFTPKIKTSRFCSPKCSHAYHNRKHREKVAAEAGRTLRPFKQLKPRKEPLPPVNHPEASYCAKCRAHTTHKTAEHDSVMSVDVEPPKPPSTPDIPAPLDPGPRFMPGYEKSQEELDEIGKEYEHVTLPPSNGGMPINDPDEVAAIIDRVKNEKPTGPNAERWAKVKKEKRA